MGDAPDREGPGTPRPEEVFLDGLEPGGPIDVVAAIGDMAAFTGGFTGGRPLTCRA